MTNSDVRAGEAVTELIDMLSIAANEEGCTVFDHTPEEIGLHVMENHAAVLIALAGTGGGVPEGGTAQEPAVARDGRCTNCDCDFCRRHWQTKSNLAAVARDPKSRCWSCSCGWVGCYTGSDIAEYGEPSECNDCHRERLVECEQTALKQPSPTPTSPDESPEPNGKTQDPAGENKDI